MVERVSYRPCRCGQKTVILNTQRGKKVAVNDEPRGHEAWKYEPVGRLETFYRHGAHQLHLLTCTKPRARTPERKRYV